VLRTVAYTLKSRQAIGDAGSEVRSTTTTKTLSGHGRLPSLALAALGCAVAIAACGSASATRSSSDLTGQGKFAGALAFARCMRSHGVPNFPDPKVTGTTIQILGSSSGINTQSPAFKSAQQSCKHLLPGGGNPSQHQIAQAKAELLTISQCMRAHGIAGFPDPTTSPPSSRAGDSDIMGHNGVFLAVPNSIDVRSPAFAQAAAACDLGPLAG
jgi:hypothetical protein